MPLFKLFVTILNIPRIIPSFILFCLKINDCELSKPLFIGTLILIFLLVFVI